MDGLARQHSARVKDRAIALGFDAVGVCDLAPIARTALRDWLDRGYAATMRYMHRQAPKRHEPARIVPGSTRAVVLLKSYFASAPESPATAARMARYAWGDDYHGVLGELLAAIVDELVALGASPAATRAYVDAGPVPERELAQRAGLGWIAKNTMLIHPRLGSFTFIGSVFTDLPLAVDAPFASDHCGRCRACLDACPTDAFAGERVLDARRCISYLTIEHRGPFTPGDGALIGDWVFGCDVCQDVCPWNEKFARPIDAGRLSPRAEVVAADVRALADIDAADFAARYRATALMRAGAEGMRRNARQVLANAQHHGAAVPADGGAAVSAAGARSAPMVGPDRDS